MIIRGIEGANIFHDDEDRRDFLSRIGRLVEKTGTRILAWVQMDNHLLLFSGQSGLSRFMRKLLTGYAVWFNRRHMRRGHLFQDRYKSILCEEDQYLLELVRYIHLNPLRASVVKSMEELDHYPWSGHGVLVGKSQSDWQETEYVLRQFGIEKRGAIRSYRKFMEEGKGIGRRPDLVGGGLVRSHGGWSRVLSLREGGERPEHDSRILGGGDFVERIIREADETLARQIKHKRGKESIDAVISRMCKEQGVREQELRSGGQRRRISEARARIAFYLSREMGMSMAEIARNLGVGTSAVAMALKKEESN